MPIRKFRSLEEADRANWHEPFAPENLRIVVSLSTTLRLLGGWSLPKGVFKYTSAEAADAAWDEVVRARVRDIRARTKVIADE
jgi:hypothetical protein